MICYLFTFAAMAIAIMVHSVVDFTAVDKILFAIGAVICTVVPSYYIQRMRDRINNLEEKYESIKNKLNVCSTTTEKEEKK